MTTTGNIDLLRLEEAVISTVYGKQCLIIPTAPNDIYVPTSEDGTPRAARLGIIVADRREPSQYGDTQYVKQSLSKQFRENPANHDLIERRKSVFLGDLRPFQAQTANVADASQGLAGNPWQQPSQPAYAHLGLASNFPPNQPDVTFPPADPDSRSQQFADMLK